MRFRSSRGGDGQISYGDAVFRGLARDGGLYIPVALADLSEQIASLSSSTGFLEVAQLFARAILEEEFDADQCELIARRAFRFEPAVRPLDDGVSVVELFHGPSCAFKDFGASFLAATMEEILSRRGSSAVVLVATSGDTGSAVAQAFHGRKAVRVVILYPAGRVSELQERQLTTLGGNVSALRVHGSFDDCQRLVKQAFGDGELRSRMTLTSANSINVGRFLPQAIYYAFAWARARASYGDAMPTFVVPSGNLGNLCAGLYAWRWGMPARRFVAATNVNDVLPEYLDSGLFSPRPSIRTLSNAMDVGNPSNMERILDLFGRDVDAARAVLEGVAATDGQTLEAIEEVHRLFGYAMDPHTAVGWTAVRRMAKPPDARHPVLLLATAHPAKFPQTMRRATGVEPRMPERLREATDGEPVMVDLENRLEDLRDFLLSRSAEV